MEDLNTFSSIICSVEWQEKSKAPPPPPKLYFFILLSLDYA